MSDWRSQLNTKEVIDAKIGKKWMEVTVKKIDVSKGKLEVKVNRLYSVI